MDPSGLPKSGEAFLGNTPGSQGVRTQVNSADSLPPVATRGGSVLRPKLPQHQMCGVGFGSIGGVPGQMDHGPMRGGMGPTSLGGFRGRGFPPVGLWPRPPGRGLDRGDGGGPCSWGYPAGRGGTQNYYTDYTYSHKYTPE